MPKRPYETAEAHWPRLKPRVRQKRKDPTPAEAHLWRYLRNRRLNQAKFRRQHAIGRYIVDFVCLSARLVIEVDGAYHGDKIDYDRQRQAELEGMGYRVLRFSNEAVLHQTREVLRQIAAELNSFELGI
ncbi:MAG: endonuclease domain-containing protein [Chloroflexi bacterium]|nr:MAG: endonuclease domain-containing protein [Chloroflexota bacterium]